VLSLRPIRNLHANEFTVRTTRARIIHLRNDYKALMSKIELGLHEHHAKYRASDPLLTTPSTQAPSSSGQILDQGLVDTPFAEVNSVEKGSPADDAGLEAGDRIRRFGHVNWINHEKLSKVAEVVQRNQGVSGATYKFEKALLIWVGFVEECRCQSCPQWRGADSAAYAEE